MYTESSRPCKIEWEKSIVCHILIDVSMLDAHICTHTVWPAFGTIIVWLFVCLNNHFYRMRPYQQKQHRTQDDGKTYQQTVSHHPCSFGHSFLHKYIWMILSFSFHFRKYHHHYHCWCPNNQWKVTEGSRLKGWLADLSGKIFHGETGKWVRSWGALKHREDTYLSHILKAHRLFGQKLQFWHSLIPLYSNYHG